MDDIPNIHGGISTPGVIDRELIAVRFATGRSRPEGNHNKLAVIKTEIK